MASTDADRRKILKLVLVEVIEQEEVSAYRKRHSQNFDWKICGL